MFTAIRRVKQPAEIKEEVVDCRPYLVSGETLQTITVGVRQWGPVTPPDPHPFQVTGAIVLPDRTHVQLMLAGGTHGYAHTVSIRVYTSRGRREEIDLFYFIQELGFGGVSSFDTVQGGSGECDWLYEIGIVATGTSKATARQLVADYSVVATTAPLAGVILRAHAAGGICKPQTVVNMGASDLRVFPHGDELFIRSTGVVPGPALIAGGMGMATFAPVSPGRWVAV